MENATPNTTIPSQESSSQSPKITFSNRFLHLSLPHNRVNRSGFFFNIIAMGIVYEVIDSILGNIGGGMISGVITLFFLLLYVVQVKKRCHDFGNNGTAILVGIIIFLLSLQLGPTLYYTYVVGNMFAIIGFLWEYGIYVQIASLLPLVILSLIPGNLEDNQYGKSYQL